MQIGFPTSVKVIDIECEGRAMIIRSICGHIRDWHKASRTTGIGRKGPCACFNFNPRAWTYSSYQIYPASSWLAASSPLIDPIPHMFAMVDWWRLREFYNNKYQGLQSLQHIQLHQYRHYPLLEPRHYRLRLRCHNGPVSKQAKSVTGIKPVASSVKATSVVDVPLKMAEQYFLCSCRANIANMHRLIIIRGIIGIGCEY